MWRVLLPLGLLIGLWWVRNILRRPRLMTVLWRMRDVLPPTGLRRGLGIVTCVRRLPVFDRQAGPLCVRGA